MACSEPPPIKEKNIAGSGTLLSELTDTIWSEMLKEAYDCLNSDKNHRGRAKQFVTLMPRSLSDFKRLLV